MVKKRVLVVMGLLSMSICGHAQGLNKDSLLHLLPTAKEDTAKIRLLLYIQKQYATKNYDSSLYYLTAANALAQRLHTDQFDFLTNVGFAEYYYYNNDYDKAIGYALKNKAIAERENDMKQLAKCYNNLAAVYNHFGRPKYAIEYILKCLDVSEKTRDSASFPVRNLTASNTYYNLNQFDKSIVYARRAIEFGKAFNNPYAVAMGLNNLSSNYSALYKVDSAIMISQEQLAYAKEQEDVVNINYSLINLCYDHFVNGDTKSLEKYSKELVSYAAMLPDEKAAAQIHNAIALHFLSQRQYGPAQSQLDSGITIAKAAGDADALGNLYHIYSVFYYTQGKLKEGEYYNYRYDSIINAGNLQELNLYTEELETKYETQKKESQIKLQQAQLKQKNTLNYLLGGAVLSVVLIGLFGYRSYRHKQKLQQAKIDEFETEKQLTATEAVLKGEEQERTRLAKDLHDGLGGMLSGIKYSLSNMKENLLMTPDNAQAFERSIDMLDSSIREMRRVAHNMMPEMLLKYGLNTALKEFCNEVSRSGALQVNYHSIGLESFAVEQTVSVTVYRIVQELVNNAIKHAEAKNVLVQLHVEKNQLAVTVEDDGKGFDPSQLQEQGGMGWKNIQSRVDFLKGSLDVKSDKGSGTSVMIEINI